MKVYFAIYDFTDKGTSGAHVYHYNLAQILLSWGWQVRALNQQCKAPYKVGEVEVFPTAYEGENCHVKNQEWSDIVITFPMPHKVCKVPRLKIIIKHNDGAEPFDFSKDKILYCGEAVRQKLKLPCIKDHVWNPVNRYAGTDKRGTKDGPWILVNCNQNKGGEQLIRLAKMCPDVQFAGVLGTYGKQIQEPLPNLQYWPVNHDMSQYYQRAAGLLSLSAREGFPTVVMEAMSHGLPVVGLSGCPGFVEVLKYTGTVGSIYGVAKAIRELSEDKDVYNYFVDKSLERSAEIESNRDEKALLNFLVN